MSVSWPTVLKCCPQNQIIESRNTSSFPAWNPFILNYCLKALTRIFYVATTKFPSLGDLEKKKEEVLWLMILADQRHGGTSAWLLLKALCYCVCAGKAEGKQARVGPVLWHTGKDTSCHTSFISQGSYSSSFTSNPASHQWPGKGCERWRKCLGTCRPHGRPRWSAWLQLDSVLTVAIWGVK